jgi:hypothetical protein
MALVSPSRWLHARAPRATLVLARARGALGSDATGSAPPKVPMHTTQAEATVACRLVWNRSRPRPRFPAAARGRELGRRGD